MQACGSVKALGRQTPGGRSGRQEPEWSEPQAGQAGGQWLGGAGWRRQEGSMRGFQGLYQDWAFLSGRHHCGW